MLGAPSVLDQPIALTCFPTQTAGRKGDLRMSLREFAAHVEKQNAPDKGSLPWFKLARFGDKRTEKHSLRSDANVITVSGVEGDYDAGLISPADAEARLRAAGIAALVYTTPSHSPERPRWRVFAPFAEERSPDERRAMVERLNGLFDGELDGASFTLSQSFYGGNVRGRAPIETRLIEGRPIDAASDLDATALPKKLRRVEGATVDAEDGSGSGALFRLACKLKARDDDKATFERAAREDSRSRAHLEREEKVGRGRAQRALDRAWSRAPEREIPFEDLGPEPEGKTGIKPSRLSFLTPDQCTDAPSRGYVLKGMVAPGDVACIFGAPGAGKSLIAPYIGYRVARGERAFGMRTKAGGVFYVAAEDPHGMRGRVTALRMTHGDADDFTLVEGVSDLLSKDSPDLLALRRAVADRKPTLVFIDTLAMAFPGLEENSAEGMGRVVAVARALAKHGAAVILIHHSTKDSNGTPRGHSLLNGALDVAMELQARDENGIIRGRLTKNRNGPCDLDIAFRIGTVDMGADEDGDPISIAHCEEIGGAIPQKVARLSPAERAALDVLHELERTGADRNGNVRDAEWRTACECEARVSAAEDRDSRKRAVRRAVQALVRKSRVVISGENVRSVAGIDDGEFDDLGDDTTDDLTGEPLPDKGGQTHSVRPLSGLSASRDGGGFPCGVQNGRTGGGQCANP